jgi:hypothetical protein
MLRRDRPFLALGGAALAHGVSEHVKAGSEIVRHQEVDDAAHVGGRALIEERGGVRRERVVGFGGVLIGLLGEETVDGEVVAEDADAALGGARLLGDLRGGGALTLADVGENIELDSRLNGGTVLVRGNGLEELLRRGLGLAFGGGHGGEF